MGLLTGYVIYRSGKKRAERAAAREREDDAREASLICDHCGHTLAQHSQDGRLLCPSY